MNAIRKEIVIGDCRLILGDAMAILPSLPSADLIVSDVPYALTTGGVSKSSKTMSGIFASHNYRNDGQLIMATVPFPEMMAVFHGALVEDADCYVMANDKNVHPLMDAAFGAGFSLHNLLVWDKVTPTANRWYMKNVEFTLYLWKGRARTINDPSSKQLLRGGIDKATEHPTEKPVHLMAEYVRNSSKRGETVLDPFMGSGTTGVAAAHLGRKFVGIELHEPFFDMAVARIRAAHERPDMFASTSEVAA
ncbi:DNA methyltransferase [Mesorhizobium sp. BE184]|uniref:DNA-methyltransferase n=1 Tax=Mesorhizobium sp. BE184 TaxID=2817714 RepID=UPI00285E7E82|nr:DNA methyltransferase [Mesorhizobium sp. BE184]MDR7032413.1 site-specific DNA-methyltransferase (adenine-specific) [Mesorhizobium sp. BE184]